MKFSKAKCKVLHVGQTIPNTSTGWVESGSKAALRRRIWGYWWMRSSTWADNVRLQPKKPTVPWAASRAAWPAGWGRGFCPFTPLSWDPTWSPASSSWMCWSRSRGGPQRRSEGCSTSATRTGWGSWGCSAWRREGSGVTLEQPARTWRGLQKGWRGTFHESV